MQGTVLIFPDALAIADFISAHFISHAEVDSKRCALSAPLTDEEIVIACTRYGAYVQVLQPRPDYPLYNGHFLN